MSMRTDGARVIATVECRMTSSRLPGKVMLASCGKPMLAHIAERLARVERLDGVVFATTVNATDDCIERLAGELGVGCFRGSEEDVLGRVLGAARNAAADIIVEITGDCPLIDPDVTAQTIDLFMYNPCDYAANDIVPSYPLGMDCQVFSMALLEIADREGTTSPDREHVSWFFLRNPERFRLLTLPAPPSLRRPGLRLTLDEEADFQVIDGVFRGIYPRMPAFALGDILDFLDAHPDLARLNAHVVQRGAVDET